MNPDVGSTVLMDMRRAPISRNPATQDDLGAHKAELRRMSEEKSGPCFCTARLFEGELIGPRDSRRVPDLCLALGVGSQEVIHPERVRLQSPNSGREIRRMNNPHQGARLGV